MILQVWCCLDVLLRKSMNDIIPDVVTMPITWSLDIRSHVAIFIP